VWSRSLRRDRCCTALPEAGYSERRLLERGGSAGHQFDTDCDGCLRGDKGTHTYVGDWMYSFPNSPQAILPGSQSFNGQTLYFDPSVPTGVDANGHTSQIAYLRPLYGQFGWSQDIYYNCMCGDTHYNALQITVDKRISHGLSITGNYAYQLSRNYDSGGFYPDKKATYGPSDLNFDQVATIFGFYKLPLAPGRLFQERSRWVDALIGGIS